MIFPFPTDRENGSTPAIHLNPKSPAFPEDTPYCPHLHTILTTSTLFRVLIFLGSAANLSAEQAGDCSRGRKKNTGTHTMRAITQRRRGALPGSCAAAAEVLWVIQPDGESARGLRGECLACAESGGDRKRHCCGTPFAMRHRNRPEIQEVRKGE